MSAKLLEVGLFMWPLFSLVPVSNNHMAHYIFTNKQLGHLVSEVLHSCLMPGIRPPGEDPCMCPVGGRIQFVTYVLFVTADSTDYYQ